MLNNPKNVLPLDEFIRFHYKTNEGYEGKIMIVSRSGKRHMRVAATGKPEEIASRVDGMRQYGNDLYVTPSRFKNGKRRAANVFGYSSVVVDVDVLHGLSDSGRWADRFVEFDRLRVLDAALHVVSEIPSVFRPSAIVFTGRGFQVWHALEPMGKGSEKAFRLAAKGLCELWRRKMDEACASFTDGTWIDVDESASSNPAGLMRLPGTKNSKARAVGYVAWFEPNRHSMTDLVGRLLENGLCADGRPQKKAYRQRTAGFDAMRRVEALIALAGSRVEAGDACVGKRDLFCLIAFSALLSAGHGYEEALDGAKRLNAVFPRPLGDRELETYVGSSARKGGYRYKNETIVDLLGMDDDEAAHFGFRGRSARRPKGTPRRANPDRKPADVVVELCLTGRSVKEIAAETKRSETSVRKILKRARVKTADAKIRKGAERDARAGKTAKEIADRRGISRATAYRIVAVLAKRAVPEGLRKLVAKPEETASVSAASFSRAVAVSKPNSASYMDDVTGGPSAPGGRSGPETRPRPSASGLDRAGGARPSCLS